jgi:hypothetical protein
MLRDGKVMQNTRFPKVWKSKMVLRGFKETIGEQLRKMKVSFIFKKKFNYKLVTM